MIYKLKLGRDQYLDVVISLRMRVLQLHLMIESSTDCFEQSHYQVSYERLKDLLDLFEYNLNDERL